MVIPWIIEDSFNRGFLSLPHGAMEGCAVFDGGTSKWRGNCYEIYDLQKFSSWWLGNFIDCIMRIFTVFYLKIFTLKRKWKFDPRWAKRTFYRKSVQSWFLRHIHVLCESMDVCFSIFHILGSSDYKIIKYWTESWITGQIDDSNFMFIHDCYRLSISSIN